MEMHLPSSPISTITPCSSSPAQASLEYSCTSVVSFRISISGSSPATEREAARSSPRQ